MDKKRKYYFVLQDVDESIIGLKADNWEIKAAHSKACCEDDFFLGSIHLYPIFQKVMFSLYGIQANEFCHGGDNKFFIYATNDKGGVYEARCLINALRLFKSSSVGISASIAINSSGGSLVETISSSVRPYYNSLKKPLVLSEEEKNELVEYLNKKVDYGEKTYIVEMLKFFHESYSVANEQLSFVLRVMIMEMLIAGNTELSFRIARSVAVLLGKTEEDSKEIYKKCKKIYTARSCYLHDGVTKHITSELQNDALDISRRIIKRLMSIDEPIENIRECLDCSGYGSYPWQ